MRLAIGRFEFIFNYKRRSIKHGTRGGYQQGCRCDLCVTVQRNYHRVYMRNSRAKAKGETNDQSGA